LLGKRTFGRKKRSLDHKAKSGVTAPKASTKKKGARRERAEYCQKKGGGEKIFIKKAKNIVAWRGTGKRGDLLKTKGTQKKKRQSLGGKKKRKQSKTGQCGKRGFREGRGHSKNPGKKSSKPRV